MKRKKRVVELRVVISEGGIICSKCRHDRKGEPYAEHVYHRGDLDVILDNTCWRCCRDAESTLLIEQKWPLAFNRVFEGSWWRLEWSPGVKELVGGTDGNKS